VTVAITASATVAPSRRLLRQAFAWGVAVLLYLVILAVVFSVLAPSFMSGGTLSAVLDLTSPLLVVGGAMTMCLIAAEVDLSVAGVVGLSSTLTALLLLKGQPWPIAVVAAVAAGGVVGVINGVLTARLVGLIPLFPSFLPTLAMQWVCIGVAGALEPSQQSITISDPAFAALFGGLLPLAYAIVVVILIQIVLSRSALGYRIFAVGSNRSAARLVGIDVARTKASVLALSGLLTGFAGVIMAGYFQGGYANVAQGIELDAIAAAVIGGTALFGGRGSALGTLLGVLVLAVLDTGLLLLQVSPALQLAARGIIVIFAVATDLYVRRLAG
jgi:ribose/xylose/arabinose/galactoside ABC-type transport system permease subunit